MPKKRSTVRSIETVVLRRIEVEDRVGDLPRELPRVGDLLVGDEEPDMPPST